MNERRQQFNIDHFNEERLSKSYKKAITNTKSWPIIGFFVGMFSKIADNYKFLEPVKNAFNKLGHILKVETKSFALDGVALIAGAASSLKDLIYSLPMSVLKFVEDLYLTVYGKVDKIGHLPAGLALVFRGINWINAVLGTAIGGVAVYLGLIEFLPNLGLSVAAPVGLAVSLLPMGVASVAAFAALVKTLKTAIEWARATDPKDIQNLKSKFFQSLTTLAVVAIALALTIVFAANPVALFIVSVSALVAGGLAKHTMKKIFPEYEETKKEEGSENTEEAVEEMSNTNNTYSSLLNDNLVSLGHNPFFQEHDPITQNTETLLEPITDNRQSFYFDPTNAINNPTSNSSPSESLNGYQEEAPNITFS